MSKMPTNSEIINILLTEDAKNIEEHEEIIHMLLDKTFSKNLNNSQKGSITFGDKISDKMADIAGSWRFIISFCVILMFWIVLNAFILLKSFDPFPFILLNLVLSCIAALQAPVIMMSQNRQEKKDRVRAENDYKINLKSELIIEDLHSKLDKLISDQEYIILRLDKMDGTK